MEHSSNSCFHPGAGKLRAAESRIEKLEARIDAIANYADPDFPLETVEAEARRAWRIIYTLKDIASGKESDDE
jgi:hypothetical protein